MQEVIKAIYEDGVIKPLEKLDLKEHETLTIAIVRKAVKSRAKNPAHALVGIFDSGLGDLSKDHDSHLYGWKK